MVRNRVIKVLVTEIEYEDLLRDAGDVSMSKYCRKILVGSEPRRADVVQTEINRQVSPRKPSVPTLKDATVDSAAMPTDPEPVDIQPRKPNPKWKNKYCPVHHQMGCFVCE